MNRLKRFVASMTAVALLAAAPLTPAAAQRSGAPSVAERLTTLRAQEVRVMAIGERLAVAAAPWCRDGWTLGWILGDLGQYPKDVRLPARREWQVPTGGSLFVASVAPGSAAAAAGLTPGVAITGINGEAPMRYTGDRASRHALANSERLIEEALTANGGRVSIATLTSDGARATVDLQARRACASRFEVAADEEKQAYADGSAVIVTLGMATYANDTELAGVIAHELAHNMLRHRLRQDARGVPNGYTRYLGRNARVVRGFEEEADRLSVWLLQQAGYDPTAPIAFWHRFGPDNDSPHPFGRLHSPWRDRVRHLEEEIASMQAARAADRAATPVALIAAIREAEAAEAAGTRTESEE